MTIKVGDKVPSVTLRYVAPDGVKAVTTDEFFGGKKVVLFGLPGAYTRTCSERHLPGYVTHAAELKAKGVDTVACLSANDHFVMNAWGKERGADDKVVMLGDGSGGLHARDRARARPRQGRHGHPLAALFDVGRERRRQGAACRAAGPVRRLQRRSNAEGALGARREVLVLGRPFRRGGGDLGAAGGRAAGGRRRTGAAHPAAISNRRRQACNLWLGIH